SLLLLLSSLLLPASAAPLPSYNSTACNQEKACWTGTEACCQFIDASFYSTSSSDRIAFYDPGSKEYKRFAEDPEYLAMNNLQNQIDFSPDGNFLFFSGVDSGYVDFYSVSTGEFMGFACSRSVTHDGWRPAALRINRNDGLHYVSDAVGGGAIIRYPTVCVDSTGAPNYEIVFQVADMRVEDIAFGDNRT
ncbi:hypothetical protein TeGR_g7138, partial [Tetraparma gracilis]